MKEFFSLTFSRDFAILRAFRGKGLVAMAALVVVGTNAQAQTKKAAAKPTPKITKEAPPPYTGPSTQSGIYTDVQAKRGSRVYSSSCRSCHSPQTHTGATFAQWWRGKQLSDL